MANGGYEGNASTASPGYHANYATVLFLTAPTDADYTLLDNWMKTAFSVPTQAATKRLVYGGSSLIPSQGTTLGQSAAFLMAKALGDANYDIVPTAIAGENVTNEYALRTVQDFAAYNAAQRNVLVIDAASNDISGATYASAAAAQSGADSFYTSTIVPCVQAAKAAGFDNVVVPTIVGRTGFDATTNFRLTALQRLNADIVAGASANGYFCADRYGDARLADPTNTAYFFTDFTHLNNAGTAIMAAIDQAAVTQAFA